MGNSQLRVYGDDYPMAPTQPQVQKIRQDHEDEKLLPPNCGFTHRCPHCGHLMYQTNQVMCIACDFDVRVTCVHCGYAIDIPVYSPTVMC